MVEDGGDDVRHRETEASLKEKDGVEDVMGLVTLNCGLCQRWDCSLRAEANLEREWVGIALEYTARNEQP